MKPNFKPLYVHTRSNHPPKVIEAIPKGVNYRLSNISCNVEKFDKVKPVFQKALDDAGHKFQLNFNPDPKYGEKKVRKRTRKKLHFNPPFCKGVKTPVGRLFL